MKFFSYAGSLILVSLIFTISIFGQQKKEREVKNNVLKNEPIKIVKVKIKNKEIKLKEKFLEDDDWLSNFSVELENISNQTIRSHLINGRAKFVSWHDAKN